MSGFLKKRSVAAFVYAGIAILTLTTGIIYFVFSSTYGIRSIPVLLSSLAVVALAAVLFAKDTVADSYIEVVLAVFAALALSLFVVSCVGDYADAVSHIVMFGSGTPISGIIAIDVMMLISLIASFIASGMNKGVAEAEDAKQAKIKREEARKGKEHKKIVVAMFAVGCIIALAVVVSTRFFGGSGYTIEKNPTEHGSYVFEIKGSEVSAASEGDVVSVVCTPDDGFRFNSISVTSGSEELTTFKSGNNQYSFTMPASSVSVSVKFGYKPTEYIPDDSITAQAGFSTASLLTFADGTFEYTYVTTGEEYGATLTKTNYYFGTWSMDGNDIILAVSTEDYTYSFTHPRTEAAKAAYDQFCEEYSAEITEKLDSSNTAYIRNPSSNESLTFALDSSAMTFGIK